MFVLQYNLKNNENLGYKVLQCFIGKHSFVTLHFRFDLKLKIIFIFGQNIRKLQKI